MTTSLPGRFRPFPTLCDLRWRIRKWIFKMRHWSLVNTALEHPLTMFSQKMIQNLLELKISHIWKHLWDVPMIIWHFVFEYWKRKKRKGRQLELCDNINDTKHVTTCSGVWNRHLLNNFFIFKENGIQCISAALYCWYSGIRTACTPKEDVS